MMNETVHLSELRRRRGLTIRQVAGAMGVSAGEVIYLEGRPIEYRDVATIAAYVRALGGTLELIAGVAGAAFDDAAVVLYRA